MRLEQSGVRLDPSPELLAARLKAAETACVVATVVSALGSTYRKPGARMLIEADGRITGLLSGGCFEQDLREHSAAVLANGVARTVTYDMRGDNDLVFGLGSGCEGSMHILLESASIGSSTANAIITACDLSRRGESVALATIHEGPAEFVGTHLWRAGANLPPGKLFTDACGQVVEGSHPQALVWAESPTKIRAWVQPLPPLPAILICGAGPDAVPVVAALQALHFPVTVVDHRPAYADASNFPGAEVALGTPATLAARLDLTRFFATVVMSHHLPSDADYLRNLAPTNIPYIGLLGPRARRDRLLTDLGSAADSLGGRIRGPVGLDIGAVTPEGIALAIAAEIHAEAATRGGGHFNSLKATANGH
jgi:xanthine dehydrogenase accessory factor